MLIRRCSSVPAAICIALVPTSALPQDNATTPAVSFGGFIRAEYGHGDRYPAERGEDRLGVSKAALGANVSYGEIDGVFVIGTERLTDGDADNDGNVDIKDAYIVVGDTEDRGFSVTFGAQPLLFGLKPNGYPGDRSLQPSIEYGGAGGFAVSNQAGPSVVAAYKFSPRVGLRFGAFDLDEDNAVGTVPATDGSSIADNVLVQLRGTDLFVEGLYATIGVESIYVGGAVNDSKPIAAMGVGFKRGAVDASLELMSLDRQIVGTLDDERYVIAEVAFLPNEEWMLYVDLADSSESRASTLRVGTHYELMRHLTLSAEYSSDDLDVTGAEVESVDVRLALSF